MRPQATNGGRVRYIPGPVYYMPREGYEGLVLEASLGAEEETGRLIREIVGLVDQLGYNVHKLVVSDRQEGQMLFFLVVRRRSGGRDLETLMTMLSRLPQIRSVRPGQRHEAVLYSEDLFPPMFLGDRSVMMGTVSLEGLVVKSRDIMGKDIASLFLNRLGTFMGKRMYEGYRGLAGDWSRQETIRSFLRMILSITGWALLEDYKVDRNGVTIVLRDLWETQLLQENGISENPHITLGMIASLFEEITSNPVDVTVKTIRQKEGTLTVFQIKLPHRPPSRTGVRT